MKHKSLLPTALLCVFGLGLVLVLVMPVVAKGKDTAPGQANAETYKSSQGNSGVGGTKIVIGSVEEVSGSEVTLEEKKNKLKTHVALDQETQVVGQGKKDSKLGAIKLKDLIALVSTDSGGATGGGKLRAKKIFVKEASESAQLKRRAVQGVIVEISGDTITLAHQIQRERTFVVIKNALTVITGRASTGNKNATDSANITELSVGQRIVAVGDLGPNGEVLAKRIHVIPGKATGIFKKQPVSTPSASLVATPSASASVSASSSPAARVVPSSTPESSPAL